MELIDLYDKNGKKLNKTYMRGDKTHNFNKNEHIPIVMIYIENSKGEFLIQKTSPEKGHLYASTGGHVDSGEEIDDALVREVKEELGLDVDIKEVKYLGHIITGAPIRFLYYLKKDINIDDLKIDKEEVESVRYMCENEINNLIEEKLFLESHAICFNKILEYKRKGTI
jgi:8-oxo-dGTP pyrophosphatase MutT (NUDIX family)